MCPMVWLFILMVSLWHRLDTVLEQYFLLTYAHTNTLDITQKKKKKSPLSYFHMTNRLWFSYLIHPLVRLHVFHRGFWQAPLKVGIATLIALLCTDIFQLHVLFLFLCLLISRRSRRPVLTGSLCMAWWLNPFNDSLSSYYFCRYKLLFKWN